MVWDEIDHEPQGLLIQAIMSVIEVPINPRFTKMNRGSPSRHLITVRAA